MSFYVFVYLQYCQKQQKSLREKFKQEKEKNNTSRSGNGASGYIIKWSLNEVMKFIELVLAPRK